MTAGRILDWAPRVLCVAFAAFLGLFAMDVFEESAGFWQTTLALLMHLLPSFLVLLVLAVSWRREWIAAILLPLLAAFHLVSFWGRLDWSGYAIIEGPMLIVGALFLINWRRRAKSGTIRPRMA